MEGIEIKVIDREAMLHLVQGLQDFEKDESLKRGLRAGAIFFQRAGMSRLRQRMKKPNGVKGNLLRSFTVRVKRNKLGVLSGFKYGENGGNHSWLVDMGTDERRQKKSGRRTGTAKALRYWSDTREQDYPKALDQVYAGIEQAVNRITGRR